MRPQTVTDEEILAVARSVFYEQGARASVESIAKELGLSQPALFKRFGTKRKLMIEAIRPPKILPWKSVVEALPDNRPFEEQLRDVAEAMATFLQAIFPMIKVVMSSDITPREIFCEQEMPLPIQAITAISEWLERCYEKGLIRKANYRVAAMSLLGIFQLEKLSLLFNGEISIYPQIHDEFLDEVIKLVWQGLKHEE